MKFSPWLIAVALAVPVAGAYAGSKMSADPVGPRHDLAQNLPNRQAIAVADASTRTQPRLPDHYAMETPEGTVEVHELAIRGRYSDRVSQYDHYQQPVDEDIAAMEADWDEQRLDERAQHALEPAPESRQQSARDALAEQQAPQIAHYAGMEAARTGEIARANVQQAATPAAQPSVGNVRVVNVEQELARLQ